MYTNTIPFLIIILNLTNSDILIHIKNKTCYVYPKTNILTIMAKPFLALWTLPRFPVCFPANVQRIPQDKMILWTARETKYWHNALLHSDNSQYTNCEQNQELLVAEAEKKRKYTGEAPTVMTERRRLKSRCVERWRTQDAACLLYTSRCV